MAESGEGEKKEAGLLIVQSKVREVIRAKEKRVSDEVINALSEHVHQTIDKAIAYVRACAHPSGGFGYQGPAQGPQTSAAGILSLQLLGQYDDPRIPKALGQRFDAHQVVKEKDDEKVPRQSAEPPAVRAVQFPGDSHGR